MSNILYPYDPTGSAITNRVVTSIDLPRVRNRAFAPDGAPFYKDSVVIKVKATGVELPKKSYEILRLNVAATAATDKPVASIINITDENFYGEIEATVQVVGGPNINNAAAIQKMLDILASDGRTVKFSELIDVPVTMPPSYHLTYVGDLYGAESLVAALDRITAISSQGTEVTLELLNDRYDRIFDIINSLSETGGAAGLDIELLKQQVADNLIRTSNLIRQLTTTVTNHRSDSETSLEALNVRLVDHSSQLQLLVLEDTSIRDSIQAHKDAYEAYKVQMTQVTDEIDQRIDVHLNDYAQHLANYSDTVAKLAAITQRMTAAEQATSTLNAAHDSTVSKLTTLTDRVTATEGVANSNTTKATALTNRVTATEGVANAANTRSSTNATNATALTNRVTAAEQAASTLTSRVSATEGVANAANSRSTTNASSISALNARTSKVNNYATASNAQTAAGLATDLHTTPAGVKAAIAALASDDSWELDATDGGRFGFIRHKTTGMTLQWGQGTGVTEHGGYTIKFRRPFTTRPFTVQVTPLSYHANVVNYWRLAQHTLSIVNKSISATGFTYAMSAARNEGASMVATWFAIGLTANSTAGQVTASQSADGVFYNLSTTSVSGSPSHAAGHLIAPG